MGLINRCALLLAATALLPSCKDDVSELCLERPESVSKAPSGKLPCELLPPGLTLKK